MSCIIFVLLMSYCIVLSLVYCIVTYRLVFTSIYCVKYVYGIIRFILWENWYYVQLCVFTFVRGWSIETNVVGKTHWNGQYSHDVMSALINNRWCTLFWKVVLVLVIVNSKGGSGHKNWCKARVLGFFIRYFSNYYTLHHSDSAARAAPLDPRLWWVHINTFTVSKRIGKNCILVFWA